MILGSLENLDGNDRRLWAMIFASLGNLVISSCPNDDVAPVINTVRVI